MSLSLLLSMSTPRLILCAEDDANDAFLLGRAFERVGIEWPLRVVSDGVEAVSYLSGQSPFDDRARFPLPALLLLDVKMPRKNGLEVLTWVRALPEFRTLPVLMLTSSSQEQDVHRAYALGANGYLVKPNDPRDLLSMVESIRAFWLQQNRTDPRYLPPGS